LRRVLVYISGGTKDKQVQEATYRPLAVVTGASSGIGYELAKQFAQGGFHLVIASGSTAIHEAACDLQALGAGVKDV
jgi:NAD(P)-dependent dehydrogenase (short-subunit alcohol dehydrogenase family)